MATLQGAIDAIQTKVKAITGIRGAPDEPPEGSSVFPFAICYAAEGRWELGDPAGGMKANHTIHLEIHCSDNDLARTVTTAMGYSENIVNALAADPKLGGACDTITEIRYNFGAMTYGGKATIGWRFRISLKQIHAVTT